ncbi:MAG: ribonuclease P protein component [FCB group bacterium]|jgi:ribonuclease P protein component
MLKPIKGKKIFSQVYQSGKRFYEKDASAIACFRGKLPESVSNDLITYYAVVIGKRTEKKAVVRNRIKRLLRESIKLSFKEFEDYNKIFEYLIVGWKTSPGHPGLIHLKDVEPVVRKLLNKANNPGFYKA